MRRLLAGSGLATVLALASVAVVYANVSQFNDSYNGCAWTGYSDVLTTEAHRRTVSNCADYTYRYTQVIDTNGVTQIQNWSGYTSIWLNEYYYGHNDCGEMYGEYSILKNWTGPSIRSTDAVR
jgi:hypothetical protein